MAFEGAILDFDGTLVDSIDGRGTISRAFLP